MCCLVLKFSIPKLLVNPLGKILAFKIDTIDTLRIFYIIQVNQSRLYGTPWSTHVHENALRISGTFHMVPVEQDRMDFMFVLVSQGKNIEPFTK